MTLTAKFPGRCSACNGPVKPGDSIEWDKATRKTTHTRCTPGGAEREQQKTEALEASRAAAPVTDVHIPAPDGLAYLPYQRAGIAYGAARPSCLIADEPGLGKTIQAAGIINADPTVKRVLVLCPASLRINWARELTKWLIRSLSIGIASSKDWPATDVVIANYDILTKLPELYFEEWDMLIADEAHYLKNPKALRTMAVFGRQETTKQKGKPQIRARRRVLLTGTPIVNRPIEAWPLLNYLDPSTFSNFFRYAQRYCGAKRKTVPARGGAKTVWDFHGASHLDELQEKLRSTIMVRRLKKDVLTELPPKRRQVIEIPCDNDGVVAAELRAWDERAAAMEQLEADVELAKASDAEGDYSAAVGRLAEAQKVAFAAMSAARQETALAKLPAVIEHLKNGLEEHAKVVVFAHHHSVVRALAKALAEFGPVILTGETAMVDRQAAVDRFQTDPTCRVFIGGILAAGVGLTLTAASWVVFVELDWVPGNVTQAEDRCHRIGQRNHVLVQHLVLEGSLDARMAKTLVQKQDVIDRALDKAKAAVVDPLYEAVSTAKRPPATRDEKRADLDAVGATLSDEQVATIHEGLRRLRGVCDGASNLDGMGFSGVDVRIGWSLADASHLSRRQAALGLKLVNKYKRQLGEELVARAKGVA